MSSLGLYHELEQLEDNKQEVGVTSIHWHPELSLAMVKIDLKVIGINAEEALFISLDVEKPLNLEMKINTQKVSNWSPQFRNK